MRRIAIFVCAVPCSGTSIDVWVSPTANFGGGGTSSFGARRSSSWMSASVTYESPGAVSTTTSMSGVACVNETGTIWPAGRSTVLLSVTLPLSRISLIVTGPVPPLGRPQPEADPAALLEEVDRRLVDPAAELAARVAAERQRLAADAAGRRVGLRLAAVGAVGREAEVGRDAELDAGGVLVVVARRGAGGQVVEVDDGVGRGLGHSRGDGGREGRRRDREAGTDAHQLCSLVIVMVRVRALDVRPSAVRAVRVRR